MCKFAAFQAAKVHCPAAVHQCPCKLDGFAFLPAHLRCPAAVRRWTRKRHVLAADLILIPINHCNLHWCLATIATSAGTLSYFDSMGSKGLSGPAGPRVLATLEEWLMADAKDKQTALVSCLQSSLPVTSPLRSI